MKPLPEIDLSALNGTAGKEKTEQQTTSDRVEIPAAREWAKRRKASPLNTLLASTARWAESLPPDVKPLALMTQFPRLANMAAASWTNAAAFNDYLEVLLVDRRGGRQGFPPAIRLELQQLRTYYFYGWYKSRTGISIYRDGPPEALSYV